jgi:hypothetical protein
MQGEPTDFVRFATSAFIAIALSTPNPAVISAASPDVSVTDVMQSVFANRVRDGGFWRQDNEAFEKDADVPRYWMQVWRNGPGSEVVIVDAYEVKANNTCSALVHIVYSYDREKGRIQSNAYGANGLFGHGVVKLEGTVTSSEITLQLPGGGERRMRERQNQWASEAVVVEAETWDGTAWAPGEPRTWHRSAQGLPCNDEGATAINP